MLLLSMLKLGWCVTLPAHLQVIYSPNVIIRAKLLLSTSALMSAAKSLSVYTPSREVREENNLFEVHNSQMKEIISSLNVPSFLIFNISSNVISLPLTKHKCASSERGSI
jgi:hypothetical protein